MDKNEKPEIKGVEVIDSLDKTNKNSLKLVNSLSSALQEYYIGDNTFLVPAHELERIYSKSFKPALVDLRKREESIEITYVTGVEEAALSRLKTSYISEYHVTEGLSDTTFNMLFGKSYLIRIRRASEEIDIIDQIESHPIIGTELDRYLEDKPLNKHEFIISLMSLNYNRRGEYSRLLSGNRAIVLLLLNYITDNPNFTNQQHRLMEYASENYYLLTGGSVSRATFYQAKQEAVNILLESDVSDANSAARILVREQ